MNFYWHSRKIFTRQKNIPLGTSNPQAYPIKKAQPLSMSLVHPYLLSISLTTREKYMHRPLIHRDTRVFHSIWRTITVICSNPNLVNMLHLISLFNFVLSYENLYASYCAFALPILVHSKRQFYHEPTQHAHWRQEMDDKISVMHVNKTWNGVPLSAHKSSIGSMNL